MKHLDILCKYCFKPLKDHLFPLNHCQDQKHIYKEYTGIFNKHYNLGDIVKLYNHQYLQIKKGTCDKCYFSNPEVNKKPCTHCRSIIDTGCIWVNMLNKEKILYA